jgi:hypothetical protein
LSLPKTLVLTVLLPEVVAVLETVDVELLVAVEVCVDEGEVFPQPMNSPSRKSSTRLFNAAAISPHSLASAGLPSGEVAYKLLNALQATELKM